MLLRKGRDVTISELACTAHIQRDGTLGGGWWRNIYTHSQALKT